jgi:4-hydroxy-tetrahydrodipicolinate synthase
MDNASRFRGAVIPLVTPVTPKGTADETGLTRLIDSMLAAKVEGIFVLGTTGEGPSVPREFRQSIVQRAVNQARGRALVYAGIGDTCLADSIAAANDYLRAGVAAVVAQPPVYFPLQPHELRAYFQALLDAVNGPVIIYNIPSTTRVSIPLDVVAQLQGHPRFVGIKDSENDRARHQELISRFGDAPGMSIFVGVGALMLEGLRGGAEGIVPSVGNLLPDACAGLCAAASRGDWAEANRHNERMSQAAAIYQKNRTLGQSLAALKAALHVRGLCEPGVLPPLLPLTQPEIEIIRGEMKQLELLRKE